MTSTDTMIARRASRTCRSGEECAELLADLMRRHDGYNLASALVYEQFATERAALRFAGVER